MAKRKMAKAAIKKAHKIARAIQRSGAKVRNPWAVGMATEKKHLRKQRRKKR